MTPRTQSALRIFATLSLLVAGFSSAQATTSTCRAMSCCSASFRSHCSRQKKSKPCHVKKTTPLAGIIDARVNTSLNSFLAVISPLSYSRNQSLTRIHHSKHVCQSPPFKEAPTGRSPPLA